MTLNIDNIVDDMKTIVLKAYSSYLPIVDDICTKHISESELEYLLDRMLDYTFDNRFLLLFKRICRAYYELYPKLIISEIKAHKEMWENSV